MHNQTGHFILFILKKILKFKDTGLGIWQYSDHSQSPKTFSGGCIKKFVTSPVSSIPLQKSVYA